MVKVRRYYFYTFFFFSRAPEQHRIKDSYPREINPWLWFRWQGIIFTRLLHFLTSSFFFFFITESTIWQVKSVIRRLKKKIRHATEFGYRYCDTRANNGIGYSYLDTRAAESQSKKRDPDTMVLRYKSKLRRVRSIDYRGCCMRCKSIMTELKFVQKSGHRIIG